MRSKRRINRLKAHRFRVPGRHNVRVPLHRLNALRKARRRRWR